VRLWRTAVQRARAAVSSDAWPQDDASAAVASRITRAMAKVALRNIDRVAVFACLRFPSGEDRWPMLVVQDMGGRRGSACGSLFSFASSCSKTMLAPQPAASGKSGHIVLPLNR
jgi:hypothetical protein